MPIKNLTIAPSFPRIGELRKGAVKTGNKPGADLQHFRFTSSIDGVESLFNAEFGSKPNHIEIVLPFATVDENFDAWVEEWGAGSLKWRGNGETLVIWQKPDGTYSTEPRPQPSGGKATGRLKVIIPALRRLGYVLVGTTSKHDIMELHSNLSALYALRGSLQGIPLVLSRVPREISTPRDGKRVRVTKWLLHLEAAPEWVQAQLSVMQHQALPSGNSYTPQLTATIDNDTGEIIDDDEYIDDDPIEAPAAQPAVKPAAKLMRQFHAVGTECYGDEWDDKRPALVKSITKGAATSSNDLTPEQMTRLIDGMRMKIEADMVNATNEDLFGAEGNASLDKTD